MVACYLDLSKFAVSCQFVIILAIKMYSNRHILHKKAYPFIHRSIWGLGVVLYTVRPIPSNFPENDSVIHNYYIGLRLQASGNCGFIAKCTTMWVEKMPHSPQYYQSLSVQSLLFRWFHLSSALGLNWQYHWQYHVSLWSFVQRWVENDNAFTSVLSVSQCAKLWTDWYSLTGLGKWQRP